MNKRIRIGLVAMMMISLMGCSQFGGDAKLSIEEAQLTSKEENIVALLGSDKSQVIYDFDTDETVKSVQINTYELKDGAWNLIMGDNDLSFNDEKGRLSLSFERIKEQLKIGLQSPKGTDITMYSSEVDEDASLGHSTSFLSEKTKFDYGEEIPLVIQVSTAKDIVSGFNLDVFYTPQDIAKYDYEEVLVLTLSFDQ